MKAKLSMAFEDLRGKDGNVVITKGRTGLNLRANSRPRNPKTANQGYVRGGLSKSATTWKGFSTTQVAQWNAYAKTITKTNPISGKTYNPTGFNTFVALSTKFQLINPSTAIPTTPPTSAFAGDTITLSVQPQGSGQLKFTASAANATNVKTELLVQALASPTRQPQPKNYRSKGFVAFASGSLSTTIGGLNAGAYAVAYRFVNTLTGQEVAIQALQTVTVLAASGSGSSASEEGSTKSKKAA